MFGARAGDNGEVCLGGKMDRLGKDTVAVKDDTWVSDSDLCVRMNGGVLWGHRMRPLVGSLGSW